MTIEEFVEELKNKIPPFETRGIRPFVYIDEIEEVLRKAQSKRTNFEKWKDELTVEKFADMQSQSCNDCPFRVDNECTTNEYCEKALTKWANKRCD